ncbi:MAG: hypothetical protein BGN87_06420 [Rhizobiales bacterium 65-79]|jgi:hypothetical protein|nr:hypothetical protein [Hyphomicrobiales bacterium]OJU02824.1 MAG: hypothetical protein BGN87_06420 [Rhizobiales bacterium 65-79]
MADPVLDLPSALPIVERAVDAHTKALEVVSALQDYETYRNTCRSADSALELAVVQIGATIRDKSSETAVRIAGIRSTSTMGLGGALRNWLTAARNKLAAIEGREARYPSPYGTEAGMKGGLGRDDDPLNPHGFGPVPIGPKEERDGCSVCGEPFKDGDICATDINLGTCHARCLEGCSTVNLTTGERVDGPIPIYPYERAR